MGKNAKILGSVFSGIALLGLLGCTPTTAVTPTPTNAPTKTPPIIASSPKPSPTVTETAEPEPEVQKVVLAWDEIRLLTGNDELVDTISYENSPQDFINFLTPVYGAEPETKYINDGNHCWTNITTVTYPNLMFHFIGEDYNGGQLLWFMSNNKEDNAGIEVEAPNGAKPGEEYKSYLEAETNQFFVSQTEYEGVEYVSLLVDHEDGLNPQSFEDQMTMNLVGTIATGSDGIIETISAPSYFVGDC